MQRWSVRPLVPALEGLGAVLLLVAGALLAGGDGVGRLLWVVAGLVLAGVALRDALVRTRLSADSVGLTVVAGLAGKRRLPWEVIDAVRVDERLRLGVRSRLLEVDAGEVLVLLSARDLGTDPDQVLAALQELRPIAG